MSVILNGKAMGKVLLTGYMACGKTTTAHELSKLIGWPAVDLDTEIEKREGVSISSIFITKGEIYFRKIEHELLKDLFEHSRDFILSLGGGTPCYAGNHLLMQRAGIESFYLRASVETLHDRLQIQKTDRPLLSNLAPEDLRNFIAQHLFERSFFYMQAKHVIDVDAYTPSEIAKLIAQRLP